VTTATALDIIREHWTLLNKGKFDDMYVGDHPELRRAAEQWATDYDGDFEFMRDMRAKVLEAGRFTLPQARGVCNCAAAVFRREGDNARKILRVDEITKVEPNIPNGTYTVVLEDGSHVTLRLRYAEWATDMPAGTQIVEYLCGCDNERDFMGFAFQQGAVYSVWRRFSTDPNRSRVVHALNVLGSAGYNGDTAQFGEAYALLSGRCWRCGKKLTVPASIHRGLGPDCAAIVGM
jgi:hypothetical protein